MKFVAFLFLLFVSSIGYKGDAYAQAKTADSAPPFAVSISTDRPSYVSGEAIALKVAIHNRSTLPITLVHPDYWGVSEITVVDEEGRAVSPETFKGKRKAVTALLTLPPGETRTHLFENLTAWTCCYGYTFHLLKPGRYRLTVSITNPPIKVRLPKGVQPTFSGTVSSSPLLIEIRQPQ